MKVDWTSNKKNQGISITESRFYMSENPIRQRSRVWYILPILFCIFGGFIAYFAIRRDDPSKAKNCLWLGIILFVSYVAYYVVFSLMIDMFEFS